MSKARQSSDVKKLTEQVKSVLAVPREERLANWCSDVIYAMLNSPEHLKGVMFKCNDDAVLAAHKFVLGIQTPCVSPPALAMCVQGRFNLSEYAFFASPLTC
jgi:hypothetical protein